MKEGQGRGVEFEVEAEEGGVQGKMWEGVRAEEDSWERTYQHRKVE